MIMNIKKILTVCSLVLFWSLFTAAGVLADRNEYWDHDDDDQVENGTVEDRKAKLTWEQGGSSERLTWSEALAYVENLNATRFGGCGGWRLPTSKELKRLVDHRNHHDEDRPHIDEYYFPNAKADLYWTSSTHKHSGLKYAVSFHDGRQRKMSSSNRYYVRAVREKCDRQDEDGDGYLPGLDCNDNDPNINPGAVERCDGYVDNNCDGEVDLGCWNVDNDNDGQTELEGDCDDRNPAVYSGAPELCDGMDNNCDLQVDEGLTFDVDGDGFTSTDSCEGSKDDCNDNSAAVHPGAAEICGDTIDQDCIGGDLGCEYVDNDGDGFAESEGDCNDTDPAMFPGNPEVCDNKDNDCNDQVDDNLTQATTCGVGACAGNTGFVTCREGDWGNDSCDPFAGATAEICDGLDNDCNGEVDNGVADLITGTDLGACRPEIQSCINGGMVITQAVIGPVAETCDGVDNDCNGTVDNDIADIVTGSDLGACQPEIQSCINGGMVITQAAIGPVAESCDGVDNDCNGIVDNDIANIVNGSDVGACQPEIQSCVNGSMTVTQAAIGPVAESCDGVDNNCDGNIDNGIADIITGDDTGECRTEIQSCVNGAMTVTQTEIGAASETCDGLDNDCDGTVDNDVADIITGTDTGECQTGIQTCANGAMTVTQTEIGAAPETCDGLDNDCDGTVDNGIADIITGTDTGECRTGIQTCANGAMTVTQTEIGAAPETCDGLDNDCDGTADNGIANIVTGTDEGECRPEIQSCVNGAMAVTQTQIGPADEACDGLDNNCDGQIDEGLLTTFYVDGDGDLYGAATFTQDACSAPGGMVANYSDCDDTNPAIFPGAVEACDGVDNNCDSVVDEGCALPVVELEGGAYFDYIQDAYDSVPELDTAAINVQAVQFGESLILDRDVIVILNGGWDAYYTGRTGGHSIIASSVPGMPALLVSNGTVIVDSVIFR